MQRPHAAISTKRAAAEPLGPTVTARTLHTDTDVSISHHSAIIQRWHHTPLPLTDTTTAVSTNTTASASVLSPREQTPASRPRRTRVHSCSPEPPAPRCTSHNPTSSHLHHSQNRAPHNSRHYSIVFFLACPTPASPNLMGRSTPTETEMEFPFRKSAVLLAGIMHHT